MKHMKALSVSLLLAVGIFVPRAHAATATGDLNVTADVSQSCTVETTVAVAFGSYEHHTALNGTGTLNINCNPSTATTITLGQGNNPASGSTDAAPARQMGGPGLLGYALYQDAARTVVWGNTTATGLAYNGSGNTDPIPVYGQIPTSVTAPNVGAYSDTVVVTVTY